MRLALPNRGLAVRQGAGCGGPLGRTTVAVRSMLGPYQYKTHVARLRLKGAQVHEFGERVMQQGSFGDDVMQLQAYLAEQGYFSSEDGLSGYFGAVTGKALQEWQGDQGLPVSGVFDAASKWAYLRQQEAALQQATAAQAQAAVVVRPPSVPDSWRVPPDGLASGLLGMVALITGASLASTRLKEGCPIPGLAELDRVLHWTLHSLAGAIAMAGHAVQLALEPPVPPPRQQQRRCRGIVAPLPTPGTALVDDHPDYGNATAVLAAHQVAAEETAYLAAMDSAVAPPAAAKVRRLSEDELQQRIAVMKGEVSPRAPVPQRPASRKLPLGVPKPADGDPITGSKYGTYYGGCQVRDKVKQYLDGDSGSSYSSATRTGNPAARRLEGMGYQMSARSRPASKPAKPAPTMAALAPPAPQVVVEVEVMAPASGPETFRDVEVAGQAAVAPTVLLSGTELEKLPERHGFPVPVVKPGMASPTHVQASSSTGTGGPSPAAPARPVPVVKPQKRSTIGDMLRSSRVSDACDAPVPAARHPMSGSYGYAAAPPPPQQQVALRPVNTGSSYSGAAASAEEAGSGAAPVQYNSDGSVVLSSKPIKLVKPARLLPKTYGFQDVAAK